MKALSFALVLSLCAAAAPARAAVAGSMSCDGTAVSVTGYIVDIAQSNIASPTSGAGAGKVTFSSAEFEVPAANFAALSAAMDTGRSFSSCTLNAGNVMLTFHIVGIAEVKLQGGTSSVTAAGAAQPNTPASVLVTIEYAQLEIQSQSIASSPITTQGGAPITGGWNRVVNTSTVQ